MSRLDLGWNLPSVIVMMVAAEIRLPAGTRTLRLLNRSLGTPAPRWCEDAICWTQQCRRLGPRARTSIDVATRLVAALRVGAM